MRKIALILIRLTCVAACAMTGSVEAVTIAPGDILVEQFGTLTKVNPVTLERTDYPLGLNSCQTNGLAFDTHGGLFATSNFGGSGCTAASGVYRLDTSTGAGTLVSGDGLLAGGLFGIATAPNGNLFVAVQSSTGPQGSIVRVDPQTGTQSLVSSQFLRPFGIVIDTSGDLLVDDGRDNSVYRLDPNTGIKTVVSQGGLLTNLEQAGGIAIGPNGDLYVAAVDNDPAVETGLIVRIDPNTGSQTLVSYGQLLVAGNTGVTGIAIEGNGDLLVIDRRSSFGIIRIDPANGQQTGLDIGETPLDAIAVVPAIPQPYELLGLFAPYGPPELRQFKAGSAIPLKWEYARDGVVIDSSAFQATLTVRGPVNCGGLGGATVSVSAPGNSSFQYNVTSNTWQFNWKTTKGMDGCFNIIVDQPELGVTGTFPVRIAR